MHDMAICVYIYELNTNESVHIHADTCSASHFAAQARAIRHICSPHRRDSCALSKRKRLVILWVALSGEVPTSSETSCSPLRKKINMAPMWADRGVVLAKLQIATGTCSPICPCGTTRRHTLCTTWSMERNHRS